MGGYRRQQRLTGCSIDPLIRQYRCNLLLIQRQYAIARQQNLIAAPERAGLTRQIYQVQSITSDCAHQRVTIGMPGGGFCADLTDGDLARQDTAISVILV